jgi:hypothetical protein
MRFRNLLPGLSLSLILACGGGGGGQAPPSTPSVPVPTLVYAAPAGGGYRLLQNVAKSRANHLVLDLVGPSGASGRGIVMELGLEGPLNWARVDSGDPEYAQSVAFAGTGCKVVGRNSNPVLQVVAAQKGVASAAVAYGVGTVLASIALDLPYGVTSGAATLTAVSGRTMNLPVDPRAPQEPMPLGIGAITVLVK